MMIKLRGLGAVSTTIIIVVAFLIIITGCIFMWSLPFGRINYSANVSEAIQATSSSLVSSSTTQAMLEASTTPVFVVTHIQTPSAVKAIYMTSWAAGNDKFRKHLFDLVDTTEINAVVIDVKDYSGRISFMVEDPILKETGASEKRIPDIKEFLGKLHEKGVYVIARISSFQDSYMINIHPEWAVKTNEGNVWKDYKGVKWLDAGAKPVWDYLVAIGKESYAVGFDELNFDYIRFPSDGNMKDIKYLWSGTKKKSDVLSEFFRYLDESFADTNIPISADLFGMTTSNSDDLNIGQVLEDALYSFDYVAPMVYPSHYPKTFNGWDNPAEKPYELIYYVMKKGIDKALLASSSPNKLRPWLQDFDLGADYNSGMVRAQIQATYDVGLNSWMLWDPKNIYTKEALLPYWQGKNGTTTKAFVH